MTRTGRHKDNQTANQAYLLVRFPILSKELSPLFVCVYVCALVWLRFLGGDRLLRSASARSWWVLKHSLMSPMTRPWQTPKISSLYLSLASENKQGKLVHSNSSHFRLIGEERWCTVSLSRSLSLISLSLSPAFLASLFQIRACKTDQCRI